MLPGSHHQKKIQHPGLDPMKPSVLAPAGSGPLLVAARAALCLSPVCRHLPGMLSASTSSQSLSSQDWVLATCLARSQPLELSPGTSHTRVRREGMLCQLRQRPVLLSILQRFRTGFANWAGGKPGGTPGFALAFAKYTRGTVPEARSLSRQGRVPA